MNTLIAPLDTAEPGSAPALTADVGSNAVDSTRPYQIVLAFVLWMALAEILTVITDPSLGLIVYSAILVTLLLVGSQRRESPSEALFLGLALIPTLRILSLGMPLNRFSEVWRYVLVCLPLLVAIVASMRVIGLRPSDVGLRLPARSRALPSAFISVSGVALGLLVLLATEPDSLLGSSDSIRFTVAVVLLAGLVGATEELLLRGVLLSIMTQSLGVVVGVVVVSAISGVLSVGSESAITVVLAILFSLYLSWSVLWTNSLAGAVLARWLIYIVIFTGVFSSV